MLQSIIINKLVSLVTSRRFVVAVGGVLATVLQEQLGLDPETAQQIVGIAIAWIVGDSLRGTKVLGQKGVCEGE